MGPLAAVEDTQALFLPGASAHPPTNLENEDTINIALYVSLTISKSCATKAALVLLCVCVG